MKELFCIHRCNQIYSIYTDIYVDILEYACMMRCQSRSNPPVGTVVVGTDPHVTDQTFTTWIVKEYFYYPILIWLQSLLHVFLLYSRTNIVFFVDK